MKLERELAKRFQYTSGRKLRPAARISIIGISLGVTLILLSLFVVRGFKDEIEQKLNNFVGTVRISNPENDYDSYSIPLTASTGLLQSIDSISRNTFPEAKVSTFIDELALIKTDSAFRAVMMHALDEDYNSSFFAQYLVAGRLPDLSTNDELLISKKVAEQIGLEVGDTFLGYHHFNNSIKTRKYQVVGLLETGFDAYDNHLAITSIANLQSVNGWSAQEVGGVTVTLPSRKGASQLYDQLFELLADRNQMYGERYAMFTVEELNYNYFGWLDLLDANVALILGLMIAVAAMTIITGIVVLILEKVQAIATLKALGQRDRSMRRVFQLMANRIIIQGIVTANGLALLIGLIQKHLHIIPLDASQYYMNYVPISINWGKLLLTNVLVYIGVFLFVFLPTKIISNIQPSRTLRFD